MKDDFIWVAGARKGVEREGGRAGHHILIYRYWLIYGDLAEIRSRVYELHNLHPHG